MTPTKPNCNVVVRDERRAHERTKKKNMKKKKPSSRSLSLSLFRALISITESAMLNKKRVQKREEKKCNDVLKLF